MAPLETVYRDFINCLNARRRKDLGGFLLSGFTKNNQQLTPETFSANIEAAGHLEFKIVVLTIDERTQTLASILLVRWKPPGHIMGIEASGKTVTYIEKHLNWFSERKLARTIDAPDREAIYRQLSNQEATYTPDFDIAAWSKDEPVGSLISQHDLESIYRDYVRCLNERTTESKLDKFFHPELIHNGASKTVETLGNGLRYIADAFPDLVIGITAMVIDEKAQRVAVRLEFLGTPTKSIMGIEAANSKRRFSEHATYQFRDGKIALAWAIGNWGTYRQAAPETLFDVNLW